MYPGSLFQGKVKKVKKKWQDDTYDSMTSTAVNAFTMAQMQKQGSEGTSGGW